MYDLCATHSFISLDYVGKLQLCVSELPYILLVSTSTDKHVRTSQVCMKLPFQINDRMFVVDLICLPLASLDLIMGMGWLSTNCVMLNYFKKSIAFPFTLTSKPITSLYFYLN